MYTLEITHIDNLNFYKEIKASTIEECFKIAHEQGYYEGAYEFFCGGIKEWYTIKCCIIL